MDLCSKSSGFEDFENTVDRGSAVIFDADSGLCLFYVRNLGPKRNLDHRSFFSLDRYLSEFIQIIVFFFFKRSSFKLKCETAIGIVLCCCLLYYLDEINSGIHMYQFTFEPLHCFWMWLWFPIWTKILVDRNIWRKKGTDRRICIPLLTPLLYLSWLVLSKVWGQWETIFLLEYVRGSFSSYVWVSKFCENARQYKCLSEYYRRKRTHPKTLVGESYTTGVLGRQP